MKKRKNLKFKENIPFYFMALPGLAYLIINNYIPMFGLGMAFQNVNFRKGMFGGEFVGLNNFEYLFTSSEAFGMFRNTLGYNLVFLILGPICGIAIAIFLNNIRQRHVSKVYQTLILLPHLISYVVISYLVYALLNADAGLINGVLKLFGSKGVSWYSEASYWPVILIIVHIWKTIGFSSIVYLSSVIGISTDYYEAANLDGATRWQQIRHITLPLLKPTVITMTILGLGNIFRSDFGLFYQVTLNQGALIPTTQTIDTYVFRGLMELGNLGMSAAAGFFQSVVGFITVMVANLIIHKVSKDNALF